MTLTINDNQSDDRRRLAEGVITELTAWNPIERMRAFKSWHAGSLSLLHLHVLTILEAEGPQSMSQLSDNLDVSVASVTGIVDRMERRSLVERRADPDDRRMVVVHLLEAGTDIFRRLGEHRREGLGRLLDRLTDDELSALLVGLRALRSAREAALAETEEAVPSAAP